MHVNIRNVAKPAAAPAIDAHISGLPGASIAPGSIGSEQLAANAVGEGNIKDGSVSPAKLKTKCAKVDEVSSGDGTALQNKVNEIIRALKDAGLMAK